MPTAAKGTRRGGQWHFFDMPPFSPRDQLVFGEDKPGPGTAGLLNEDILTWHAGDLTTQYHGQVITNLDIEGQIRVRHDGCIFTNTRANGLTVGQPGAPSYYLLVDVLQARSVATQFFDCEFRGPDTHLYNAIQGQDATFTRCKIGPGPVDGVGMQKRNMSLLGCWITGLVWHNQDPAQGGGLPWNKTTNPSGGTHNDGVQMHGGDNFNIIGTRIDLSAPQPDVSLTSCILAQSETGGGGPITNMTIRDNWLSSLGARAVGTGINMVWNTHGTYPGLFTGSEVSGNRFSPKGTWSVNHGLLADLSCAAALGSDLSDNLYEGDGTSAVRVWSTDQ